MSHQINNLLNTPNNKKALMLIWWCLNILAFQISVKPIKKKTKKASSNSAEAGPKRGIYNWRGLDTYFCLYIQFKMKHIDLLASMVAFAGRNWHFSKVSTFSGNRMPFTGRSWQIILQVSTFSRCNGCNVMDVQLKFFFKGLTHHLCKSKRYKTFAKNCSSIYAIEPGNNVW